MSRTESIKAKLLNLYRILDEQTDEEHGLTIPEILEALEARGISAERKGIYSDLQALREAGMDIVLRKVGGRCEYFIAGRTFELAELKLLVDAVACSRFITPKKSRELIGKLESLTSIHQASQLNRQTASRRTMRKSTIPSTGCKAPSWMTGRSLSFILTTR